MRLKHSPPRSREADVTNLINVIFLILIFFLMAGTIRPFARQDLELAKTNSAAATATTPGRLVVTASGTLFYQGRETTLDAIDELLRATPPSDGAPPFLMIADARLDARRLIEITQAIQAAGISRVSLLTQRTAQ